MSYLRRRRTERGEGEEKEEEEEEEDMKEIDNTYQEEQNKGDGKERV